MRNITPIIVLLLIGVAAYFLYKKFSGLTFAWGDQGGGHGPGGAASEPAASNGEDKSNTGNGSTVNLTKETGAGKKAVIIPRKAAALPAAHELMSLPDFLKPILSPVLQKMPDSKNPIGDPNIQNYGRQLAAANKDAKKYTGSKFGTTSTINKALANVKYINDTDFKRVIQSWQSIDKFASPLDTALCSNNIGGDQPTFVNRLVNLNLI